MLKRELKINLKSFIIWTGILLLLFLVTFSVYPSIINSDNIKMIDEMIKIFPEDRGMLSGRESRTSTQQ